MLENKTKKKLQRLLSDIDQSQINSFIEMIKSGESINNHLDMEKATSIIKSLNLENDITPDMIEKGVEHLKKNPHIIEEIKKK